MKTPRDIKDRAACRLRPADTSHWPEPAMIPTWKLKRCLEQPTIEGARQRARELVVRIRL